MKVAELKSWIEIQLKEFPDDVDEKDLNRFTEYAQKKLFAKLDKLNKTAADGELWPDDLVVLRKLCQKLTSTIGGHHFLALHRSNKKLAKLIKILASQIKAHEPPNLEGVPNYYQLLFPKLIYSDYMPVSVDLTERELKLSEIVLSDDETAIICVKECLEGVVRTGNPEFGWQHQYTPVLSQEAIEDIKLNVKANIEEQIRQATKDKSLEDPKVQSLVKSLRDSEPQAVVMAINQAELSLPPAPDLTLSERERVINHSKESQNYWTAIKDYFSAPPSTSFGAVLKKLCRRLEAGNSNRNLSPEEKDEFLTLRAEKEILDQKDLEFHNQALAQIKGGSQSTPEFQRKIKEIKSNLRAAARTRPDIEAQIKALVKDYKNRLSNDLSFASEIARAETKFKHENAGYDALLGVAEFKSWFNELTPQERNYVEEISYSKHGIPQGNLGGYYRYQFSMLSDMCNHPDGLGRYPQANHFYLDKDGNYRTADMKDLHDGNLFRDLENNPFAKDNEAPEKNINESLLRQKLRGLPQTLNDPILKEYAIRIALGHKNAKLTPLDILFNPAFERLATDTTTCVYLIGGNILKFIESNPILDTQYPSKTIEADNLANAEWREKVAEQLSDALKALENATQQKGVPKAYAYSQEGRAQFSRKMRELNDLLQYSPEPLPELSDDQEFLLADFKKYGLTEAHVRNLSVANFSEKRQLLHVLINGSTYPSDRHPPLKRGTKLLADAAVLEMQGLDAQRCISLAFFYHDGLKAEHFRSAAQYTDVHHNALKYFLRERQPHLEAEDAFSRIRYLSEYDVLALCKADKEQRAKEEQEKQARELLRRQHEEEMQAIRQEELERNIKSEQSIETLEEENAKKLERLKQARRQKTGLNTLPDSQVIGAATVQPVQTTTPSADSGVFAGSSELKTSTQAKTSRRAKIALLGLAISTIACALSFGLGAPLALGISLAVVAGLSLVASGVFIKQARAPEQEASKSSQSSPGNAPPSHAPSNELPNRGVGYKAPGVSQDTATASRDTRLRSKNS